MTITDTNVRKRHIESITTLIVNMVNELLEEASSLALVTGTCHKRLEGLIEARHVIHLNVGPHTT
jgi:hypothetical protein